MDEVINIREAFEGRCYGGRHYVMPHWAGASTLKRAASMLDDSFIMLGDDGEDVEKFSPDAAPQPAFFVNRFGAVSLGMAFRGDDGEQRVALQSADYWIDVGTFLLTHAVKMLNDSQDEAARDKAMEPLMEFAKVWMDERVVDARVNAICSAELLSMRRHVRHNAREAVEVDVRAEHREKILALARAATLAPGRERDEVLEDLSGWIREVKAAGGASQAA